MSSNKKNTASQALLDMKNIVSAIKEESTKSLNLMLDEAVKNALREECCKEEDDEYEVIDKSEKKKDNKSEKSKKTKKSSNMDEDDDIETSNQDEQPTDYRQNVNGDGEFNDAEMEPGQEQNLQQQQNAGYGSANGNEDEWDKYSDYKVNDGGNDDTYDLTGEKDIDTVAKVYKLLSNDDEVVVRQDGSTIQLTDNDAGTEYVIDLGTDDDYEGEYGEETQNSENIQENGDIAGIDPEDEDWEDGFYPEEEGFDPEEDDFDPEEKDLNKIEDDDIDKEYHPDEDPTRWPEYDNEYEIELGLDEDLTNQPWMDNKGINENKKRRQMKESKNLLFEVDLGCTIDDYQDKDPIGGLSMHEPSKSGRQWDKLPDGTNKPWAGNSKSKGNPFKHTKNVSGSVNEEGDVDTEPELEENQTTSKSSRRRSSKTLAPATQSPEKSRRVSMQGDYHAMINEGTKLQAENKQLKSAVLKLKKNLNEAYVTNVNLGKIAKLFLENTTTQKEKIDIVNRFCNEAKTVAESEKLYESIKKQLNNQNSNRQIDFNGTSQTAKGTQSLNENIVYKSSDLLKTIDLMNRVDSI